MQKLTKKFSTGTDSITKIRDTISQIQSEIVETNIEKQQIQNNPDISSEEKTRLLNEKRSEMGALRAEKQEWQTQLQARLAEQSDAGHGQSSDTSITSPLEQFEIKNLLGIDAPILWDLHLYLTNIGIYLSIAAFTVLGLNLIANNYNRITSNITCLSHESIYATIHSIVINQINTGKGQSYFPFIYALFTFILINNLIGMVPYSFASTSHFILTFFTSFSVVLGATLLGFIKHNLKFFSLFVPSGCPLALLPLLVLIEFISYLARNISLGLRLAANILSGHMLLNILSGFAYKIMCSGYFYLFLGLIPLAFIMGFSGLELGIAFIQAQVFVVLTSSYTKDALDLH